MSGKGGTTFSSLNAAAKALLLTSVQALASTGVFYVIAGGWTPVLYEPTHPFLKHPGTRDVDVLLLDEVARSADAARALIKAGFRPSAKHEFQLLRSAQVGRHEFVFNIDLMHPKEGSEASDLFHDLFDLELEDLSPVEEPRFVKSIALPSSSLIAEHMLYAHVPVTGTDLDGSITTLTAPVIKPVASILSKCASVAQPKRPRDAFDIFYLLTSNQGESYAAELKALVSAVPAFDQELAKLRAFLVGHAEEFENNVRHFDAHHGTGSAAIVDRMINGR
jgi:hypothetical protein